MKCRLTFKHVDNGEINSHENSKVTSIGYISVAKQVQMFSMAGRRLDAYRNGEYDFSDGVDDGRPVDPTLEPSFDLADMSYIMDELDKKVSIEPSRTVDTNLENSSSDSINVEKSKVES